MRNIVVWCLVVLLVVAVGGSLIYEGMIKQHDQAIEKCIQGRLKMSSIKICLNDKRCYTTASEISWATYHQKRWENVCPVSVREEAGARLEEVWPIIGTKV